MAFEVTLVPKENIELGVTQKAVFTLSNVTPTIPVPGPKGDKGDKGDTGPQGPQGLPGTGVNSTDDVPEGDLNLYYTEERVEAVIAVTPPAPHTHSASDITDFKDSIATILKAGTDITIDNNPGDITINADIPIVTDSNDGLMTSALKLKLDGIASGAEVNVNSDWNATTGDAAILNKPSTFPPSTHTHSDATTSVAGFMSATDKTKLDSIQAGAEVNVNADWNATSGDAQILNKPTIVSSVGATAPIISSGGINPTISTSMASNRLIGRTTAGSGVMEEISVGTGLQLSAGTLSATTIPGAGITKATASGTDTYTATISGVTTYTDGDTYLVRFTNGNTTGATLNINSLGAKTLYKNNDGAIIGGDITSGGEMLCIYNSTLNGFQCIGTAPNSLFAYVTNAETSTITKGQPVYAFGGTGDRLTVKLAYNTGDSTSAQTVGLVWSASIGANQKGLIIIQGQIDGLSLFPTATWSDGDAVYLGATAGTLTKTKPSAPNHLVYLGFVTTASNGNAGRMYVRVQNGYELQELHNVALSSPPNNNDGLFYETATSLWKNKSIPTALGYTPENVANKQTDLTASSTKYPTVNAVNTGLSTKEPTITAGTTAQYWRGDKSWQTLDKSAVGLSNVDNTSDANKPVSNATQTALNNKLNTSLKGASNGLAELDSGGKVPTTQLPSYVDDVLEYANIGALPAIGSAGIIYVTLDDNKIYRWSGTAYTVISDTIALGETSATAYRGDRGKIAYDHSQIITGNPHGTTKSDIGLGNVDNTSDANKPVSTATQTALNLKVDANTAITGATKTKITYDSKGLVTAGSDATTADIADSLNKRYVTDAQLTVIGNTSGTNTGDQNTFGTIAVSGQSNVVADATNDTLTLVAGTGVSITTNATTDTITINSTLVGVTDGDKGDITVSGGGTTWTIDPGAVTLADMANLASGNIIGRTDAGSGAPQAITIGTGLTGSASTLTANLSVGVNNGQSAIGGTRASENLTLSSTSNATKGKIILGSLSAYDEANDRLGIGTASPITNLHVVRDAIAGSFFRMDALNGAPGLQTYRLNGTISLPTGTVSGNIIGLWSMRGHDGTNYVNAARATFVGLASENWTSTAQGTYIRFETTTTGTTTLGERLRIDHDGAILIGTTTNSGFKLDVNGTARASTSLDTPIVRGSTSASSTLTLSSTSNATKGKILFGTSAYDEANDRLGIGTASPTYTFDTSGTGRIVAGSLINGGNNAFNITATMPSVQTFNQSAIVFDITSAGTHSFVSRAFNINFQAGYTGNSSTTCINGGNLVAGTGTDFFAACNRGCTFTASATTTGTNVGLHGEAVNGNINSALFGRSLTAKNSATNIGASGFALNTGTSSVQVGGYFALQNAMPTFTSAALMCDNGTQTSDIFVARDNGTIVWKIVDGGITTWSDAINMSFGTTTGTKIGTATLQKIGFWNATPIVQPATGGAAATLVSNAGTTLTSTDTFDGYTLQQIVKALRNIGILA